MLPFQGGNGASCSSDMPLSAPISNLSLSASLLLLNQRALQAQTASPQIATSVGLPWLVSSQIPPTISIPTAQGVILNDLAASSSPAAFSGLLAQSAPNDMSANTRDLASLLSFRLGSPQGMEDRKDFLNMNTNTFCSNMFAQSPIASSSLLMPKDSRNFMFGLGSNLGTDQLSQAQAISNKFVNSASALAAREAPGMEMSTGHSNVQEEGERTNSIYGVRASGSLALGGNMEGAGANSKARPAPLSVKKEREGRADTASPQSPSSSDEQGGKASSRKRQLEHGDAGSSSKRCSRYWTKEEHEIFLKALKKYHRPQGPSPNNRVRVGLGE
eukprot:754498-Hanusia_phi.AAC.4